MSESNRKLQQAVQQAHHWAQITKLLAWRLADAGLSLKFPIDMQEELKQKNHNGDIKCHVDQEGNVELSTITHQEGKMLEEQNRRRANGH